MPRAGVPDARPPREHGWAVFVLPYLELGNLSRLYRLDRDLRAFDNRAVRHALGKVAQCPSAREPDRTDGAPSLASPFLAPARDSPVNNQILPALRAPVP